MNFSTFEPYTRNVVNFTMIEKPNEIVFVEVEARSFGIMNLEIPTIHLAIQFYDTVLSNSLNTLRKMVINVAFPLSASMIDFVYELRQLFVKCSNQKKMESRRDELELHYPMDIHSDNIKLLKKIKNLSTLAISTSANFSLDEVLALKVKRIEISQHSLTVDHLNLFIHQWFNNNLMNEEFKFFCVDLDTPMRINALFENVEWQRSDDFDESMEEATHRFSSRRHIGFYRIKSLDGKRTMKIKLTQKRVEFEMI